MTRARVWSIGQPVLTLAATLLAALVVVLPATVARTDAASTGRPGLDLPDQLAPPGQLTPVGFGPLAGPGMPAGDARIVRLRIGGRERGYLLLPPLGLPAGTPAPLAVVLHQDVGSAPASAEGLGLDGLRRQGIALAYPAGIGGSWNAGGCCGIAALDGVDDVAFVDRVLDDVGNHVAIDPTRRALVGYSGGGMLAYRVLCRPHPALAAAVEVSGALEAHCPNGVQLPDLLSLHGAKDGTVGFDHPIYVTHLGMAPRSVLSTLGAITGEAGCGGRSTSSSAGVRILHWAHCNGGSTLDVQVVAKAGHGWDDLDAGRRVSRFLEQHLLGPVMASGQRGSGIQSVAAHSAR